MEIKNPSSFVLEDEKAVPIEFVDNLQEDQVGLVIYPNGQMDITKVWDVGISFVELSPTDTKALYNFLKELYGE